MLYINIRYLKINRLENKIYLIIKFLNKMKSVYKSYKQTKKGKII